jgi:hypothetical protein
MLSENFGGGAMKKQVFLSGINSSKWDRISRSQMKAMLLTFFDIKGIVHF